MKLLAIDTSEDACSAALLLDGHVEERFEVAPRRHSELILPMMDSLLQQADLRLGDLDALAFARGPGAFTGLRIAASVVQGAALGADLRVVPVSSLQALAQGADFDGGGADKVGPADGGLAVLTALDARMGEVYWGAFAADAAGIMRPLVDETVCAPQDVPVPQVKVSLGVGSGWQTYADELRTRCSPTRIESSPSMVHAGAVAVLAAALYDEGHGVAAEQALPVYLRNQVAWAKS